MTTVILILMFITPVISVMTVLLKFAEIKNAVNWPQAIGEVTAVRLLQSGKEYQPELDVRYAVEEKLFANRQRPSSKSGQTKGSKQWAREFSLQFKPGTAVTLYYDPKRPKRATLTPNQLQPNSTRWQITSSLMLLLSITMHIIASQTLIVTYFNLSNSIMLIAVTITTMVTLLLGAAFTLLIQELR